MGYTVGIRFLQYIAFCHARKTATQYAPSEKSMGITEKNNRDQELSENYNILVILFLLCKL